MILDEFLLELAQTSNWHILDDHGRQVIRSGCSTFIESCPITAVAQRLCHKTFHIHQFPEAANLIGIDYDLSMVIAITTDHRQDDERYSAELRQLLLQTLNLESLSF